MGDSLQLLASGAVTYQWQSTSDSANTLVVPTTTTAYVLTATQGARTGSDTVLVTVVSATANAGND